MIKFKNTAFKTVTWISQIVQNELFLNSSITYEGP